MMRYGRLLVPVGLLAVVLCAAPARAEDETNAQKLARIESQLRQLRATLARIDRKVECHKQLKDIGSTLTRIERLLGEGGQPAGNIGEDIRKLHGQLETLTGRLDALAGRLDALEGGPVQRTTARKPPVPNPTGTIRLENRTAESATITYNGTPYFLLPGEVRVLPNQPAGTFTWAASTPQHGVIRPTTTSTLQAGEVCRLFVGTP